MAGIFLDSGNYTHYNDPISIRIVYRKNKTNRAGVDVLIDSQQFMLSCDDLTCEMRSSVSLLRQCTFLNDKLSNEWKDNNTIIINVASEKLFYAFGMVLRFLHIQPVLTKNVSIDQMRHFLRPNSEMDIELCIASSKLGLPSLTSHLEEFLIAGLSNTTFIPSCQYASRYSSSHVLEACYTYIKQEGVKLEIQEDLSEDIVYNSSSQTFCYNDQQVKADIFDALLLKDLSLRSHYIAPGFLSCGGTPCRYDAMTEEEFRALGKRKKSSGFEGTMRCYLEKIMGDQTHSCKYDMFREDTNQYLLSAVMLPNTNSIAFFNSQQINELNVMQSIYSSHYIGVMKGNTMGTEFILYDNGTNPDLLPSDVFDDISRQVLCKITYESNIAGRKPNAMQIYLPATSKEIMECIASQEPDAKTSYASMRLSSPAKLVTKNPQWNDELKGYTLKFNGRAKKPSKRNFQLIFREDQGDPNAQVLVCFGKMSSKRFSIDYAPPVSCIQAFATALTCFMKKKLAA